MAEAFDEHLAAQAYDILSDPEKRLKHEGAFLKGFIGTGTRVLDLACGSGVHAEFLARWGAVVTACDLSEAMIDDAKMKRPHERVTYEVRDMRTPPDGEFDLILCIGNSLNMLPTREDVEVTLAAARSRLAEDGRLLLHCINPESRTHADASVTTRRGMLDGRELTLVKTMAPLKSGGRLVSLTYIHDGDEPVATASRLLDLTVGDLTAMLAHAGLEDAEWYGGLDGGAYVAQGSPDLVVVARGG